MVRGSTVQIIQTITDEDVELDNITALRITLTQPNYDVKIQKELADATIDTENKTITFTLSQEDTLKFHPGRLIVQIKWFRGAFVINTEAEQLFVDEDYDGKVLTE